METWNKRSIAHFLKRSRFFEHLGDGGLSRVAKASEFAHFRSKAELFGQGARLRSLQIIASGHVDIASVDQSGQEIVYETLTRFGVPGIMDLLDGRPTEDAAVAAAPTVLLRINPAMTATLLDQTHVQEAMAEEVRALARRMKMTYRRLALYDLETRLAFYLHDLLLERVKPVGHRQSLTLHDSQPRIALKVRASRTRVNITLQKWAAAGEISLKERQLTIHNTQEFMQKYLPRS